MPKAKGKRRQFKRTVPYVKGFHPPTKRQRIAAIKIQANEKDCHFPLPFVPTSESFAPIASCTSTDDWLAQYKEDGQSCIQFLRECPWLSKRKRKCIPQTFDPTGNNLLHKYPQGKIYVLPLGDFDSQTSSSTAQPDFDSIVEFASLFLCVPVVKLPPVKIHATKDGKMFIEDGANVGANHKDGKTTKLVKLKSRYNATSGRHQLCVLSGHHHLRDRMPDDALCMIALTNFDLYEDNTDLFVAGMAAGQHRVAIFSLSRYDPNLTFSQEFWYDVTETSEYPLKARRKMLLKRSCRLIVHELAHLLGLDHCVYFACLMNGSGHLNEDFRQPMHLCPVDLRKLHALTGCEIRPRYEALKKFYLKHQMTEEVEWLEKRLNFISVP